jgi:tetratricopeptide (TPR) repeat protein
LNLSQLPSINARINKLLEVLRNGTYLLVVDGLEVMLWNNEKRNEVCHFLTQVAETTRLIITSREVLEIDRLHTYKLPDIESQAALSIFLNNIEAERRIEANADQIAKRIVDDLLGRHPLAIELAARLTRRPDMTIASLKQALESRRLSLLNDPAWVDRPAKLRDVQLSIDLSYQGLNPTERLTFTQLTVLQNPWDEATGRAVTGLDNNEWLQIHNELFDLSLLRIQQGKYVFHPLIREFGYNHLADKVTAHKRAADYLSRSKNPMDRAEAYYHATQTQDFNQAANILLGVYSDLRTRGHYAQLLTMISETLNIQSVQDYRFHLWQAEILRLLGFVDKALKRLQWMLQRLSLQPAERVLVLNERARILKELDRPGDINQAIRDHAECIKICDTLPGLEGVDDLWLREKRANSLHDLGMLFHYYKKTPVALLFAEELYTISATSWRKIAEIDDRGKVNEALSLKQLAELAAWPGNPRMNIEQARVLFEKAIGIFRTASEEHYVAETLFQVAKLNQDIGLFDYALNQFKECESLYRNSGLKPEAAIMVKQQGEIFQDRTDGKREVDKALELYSRALQDLPDYQDKWSRRCTVKAYYRRGEAYLEVGRLAEARSDFLEGTKLALEIEQGSDSDRKQTVRSFCALTNTYKIAGSPPFPPTLLEKAKSIFEGYGFYLNMNSWQKIDCRCILKDKKRGTDWFHHNSLIFIH